jgi:hypothetical protein
MRKLSVLMAMALVLALAAPTLAAQPQRGCPPAFDGPVTIADLLALYPEFDAAAFEAFLQPLDANGDDLLCTLPFPPNAHPYGEPFFVANFIDNVANH